jgi:hypothetical protein
VIFEGQEAALKAGPLVKREWKPERIKEIIEELK